MFERQLIKYIWAAPYTAIGLAFGAVTLLFGASVRVHGGVFEFGGGHVGRLASRLPVRLRFSAITCGHVVLGIDEAKLAAVRTHERVHVRQYERWGPLFIPAYLLSSLAQLVRRRHPYRDNYFEREAYAQASTADPSTTGSNA